MLIAPSQQPLALEDKPDGTEYVHVEEKDEENATPAIENQAEKTDFIVFLSLKG